MNKQIHIPNQCLRDTCVDIGANIGDFVSTCESPKKLSKIVGSLLNDYYIDSKSPYGDGQSSQKIFNYIAE